MNSQGKKNLKDLSLNIRINLKKDKKLNNTEKTSLDFNTSPIKGSKKVIKRNKRTNSYSSYVNEHKESFLTKKNPFNSDFTTVEGIKKGHFKNIILTFSSKKNLISNDKKSINKNKNNNNPNKLYINNNNNISKYIMTHQSMSNFTRYEMNVRGRNKNRKFLGQNNMGDYSSLAPNHNYSSYINMTFKKSKNRDDTHGHFQHSNLLNINDFKNSNIFYSIAIKEHNNKKNYRNSNKTTSNLFFLTKKIKLKKRDSNKKKFSLYHNSNYPTMIEPIMKKKNTNYNFKTSKNSKEKDKAKLIFEQNIKPKANNDTNISIDEKNKNNLQEFELLYNCLKRRNITNHKSLACKIRSKNIQEKTFQKYFGNNILNQNSLLEIIYENQQIKEKNEELLEKFDNIKKEFEQMKKDNREIKEELKEKTKYLKDMKLTMDIFSQELLKMQQNCQKEENFGKKNVSFNKNDNINLNLNSNEEKEILLNSNTNETQSDNIIYSDKNKKNFSVAGININISSIPQKVGGLEKIHKLCLKNIGNLGKEQNAKGGGNIIESNNFQDTSKIINNDTKDATEKDNENLEKWRNFLSKEKEKNDDKKETNKENIYIDNNMYDKNDDDKKCEDSLSSISLADNLNIDKQIYNKTLNIKNNNIGKLDLKNKLGKAVNNDKNKYVNFNEEFLKHYDKFSDSWRKEVDKMLKKQ